MLESVSEVISQSDKNKIAEIAAELRETMHKRQIFRTDTEARISVLNDGSFPTRASKYWQSVREQSVMFENLVLMNFEMRRKLIQLKTLNRNLDMTVDPLIRESIEVDIDECKFALDNLQHVAKDRVREILMWSQIKKELDDGSFNTDEVNAHQAVTMREQLEYRLSTLPQTSVPGEVMNVLGPLFTAKALTSEGKILPFTQKQGLPPS